MSLREPGYVDLHRRGVLAERARAAREILSCCVLCPRQCRKNRLAGEKGVCRTGARAVVSSFGPHFGEEDPLVGRGGSGTIFFANCNLLCLFCQNFEISHEGEGREASDAELAAVMLALQEEGCENINLVTPSHVVPQILAALDMAAARGLTLPVVYNSSGYDSVATLKLLDGVIDIYMPDFKFWDPAVAETACRAPDYPARAREAIKEMHRQAGNLVLDAGGLARRGLLVRHLALPENLAGTASVMDFLAREISEDTYVNVMAQYHPAGLAANLPGFHRPITREEYKAAVDAALAAGLTRLDRRKRVFAFEWH